MVDDLYPAGPASAHAPTFPKCQCVHMIVDKFHQTPVFALIGVQCIRLFLV